MMALCVLQKEYIIEEKDESGFIPKRVVSAIVDYDEKGQSKNIIFFLRRRHPRFYNISDSEERRKAIDEYLEGEEEIRKITPTLTQEGRERIVSLLESSLQNSQ